MSSPELLSSKETVKSVPTLGYKKVYEYEVNETNKDKILKEAKIHKEEGHVVRVIKKEKIDTVELEEDFIVIDKTERDITNRGLSSTMSEKEKIERFVQIHEDEVQEDEREDYINAAMLFINRAKERLGK